jgi:predicted TIM-barrel fold metal-dependent hydrolase
MGLASIQDPKAGAGLPQSLLMKARHPDTFFVLAGLNHATWLSKGKVRGPGLAEQVGLLARIGCDGLKMIEGKPTSRQQMDIPVTDAYFADYWARVEQEGVPVLWHVNDPEEFWDPRRIPGWAKERNWGYGPKDAQKETLYAEVEEVLARHPRLKIAFAHFYFLSADLGRAGRFLDAHPSVSLDLAPGIEMLYNISRDPAAGRDFFVKYADRIVFGTDLMDRQTPAEGRIRAGLVFRWLETEDVFRVPPEADFLLGPPQDGVIRGMALPPDVLAKIYRENHVRRLGAKPAPLDVDAAIAECRRLAAVAEALSGKLAAETEAARAAAGLAEGQGGV